MCQFGEGADQRERTVLRSLKYLLTGPFLLVVAVAMAQDDQVVKAVQLDAVVVSAQASGFDVDAFVQRVMEDTTFYKAFLNLKFFPHKVESELRVHEKKERKSAYLYRRAQLIRNGPHAKLELDSISENGPLRDRKGQFRYLTAEMYDEVFWPKGSYMASNRIVSHEQELVKGNKLDAYKSELKKFMFNPGQEIGTVPFIGDKMALFDPEMVPFYDYRIWSDQRNEQECWVFSADAKPDERDNRTVIKSMDSWFSKRTMQVIAREYRIAHSTILLDFDIQIKVRNVEHNGQLVPAYIYYDGNWDLPFKKQEVVRFHLALSEWVVD